MSVKPKLVKSFDYKGYKCLVVLNTIGHFCGYVEMPVDHPLAGESTADFESDLMRIECHGGLTFGGDRSIFGESGSFIGFDCGHGGDGRDYDFLKESGMNPEVIASLKESDAIWGSELKQWTEDEVADECRGIVDQLRKIAESKIAKVKTI